MAVATQNAEPGPSRQRRDLSVSRAADGGDNEEDMDKPLMEEEGWTIDTFQSLPLTKSDLILTFIKGLTSSIKEMILKIEEGMGRATDAAKLIEETSPDDKMIKEIDEEFRKALEQREYLRIKIKVLEEISMRLRQNEALENPVALYTEETIELQKKYKKQTTRTKFKNNEDYIDFRAAIWDVHHEGMPQPFTTTYLPKEDNDDSDDEEMQVGPQTQNFRCMLTLLPYVDPVTSTECKHSYSRMAIMDILKKKKSVKCPYAGCRATLTQAKLQDDPELQRRTTLYQKRLAERDEADLDDE